MKTKEEIKQDFFSQFGSQSFRGYPFEQCHSIWNFFEKYIEYTEKNINKEPLRNFYLRLKNFVSNVKVNNPMSEKEKEMIISVCDKQINKQK